MHNSKAWSLTLAITSLQEHLDLQIKGEAAILVHGSVSCSAPSLAAMALHAVNPPRSDPHLRLASGSQSQRQQSANVHAQGA
jgi:hypothetical protein